MTEESFQEFDAIEVSEEALEGIRKLYATAQAKLGHFKFKEAFLDARAACALAEENPLLEPDANRTVYETKVLALQAFDSLSLPEKQRYFAESDFIRRTILEVHAVRDSAGRLRAIEAADRQD